MLGEFLFRNITYYFADLSLIISEICDFQRLEHGPTELHVWLSKGRNFRKARNKIT